MEYDIYNKILPLLEKEKDRFSHLNFQNTLIIAVQHLCSTTYSLFKSFFDLGLKPYNLHVLGKCYSTNPKIYDKLVKDNVSVEKSSLYFDSYSSYNDYFTHSVDKLVLNAVNSHDLKDYERIIILDDGGHLLERCNTFKGINLVGVEQTSSGFNRLKNKHLTFPIINAARSWIKLDYESPLIGNLLKEKLILNIKNLAFKNRKTLIIGGGPVGQNAYNVLKQNLDVDIFDLIQTKSTLRTQDFRSFLPEYDLIIGCTGRTVIKAEDLNMLKNPVILASASSSDIEFDAVTIRKKCSRYYNCHRNINADGIGLLNSGFPITFDNDFDGIDTDEYQLTRSILLASVCQAVSLKNKNFNGFLDLKDEFQKNILSNWLKLLNTNNI